MSFLIFCLEWSFKIVIFVLVFCLIAFLALTIIAAACKILSILIKKMEDVYYERRNQE